MFRQTSMQASVIKNSCARSTVARVRRANPSLAGPKGRRPGARRAPSKAKVKGRRGRPPKGAETGRDRALHVRASEAELAALAELAERQETTATEAVWRAVTEALGRARRPR